MPECVSFVSAMIDVHGMFAEFYRDLSRFTFLVNCVQSLI